MDFYSDVVLIYNIFFLAYRTALILMRYLLEFCQLFIWELVFHDATVYQQQSEEIWLA